MKVKAVSGIMLILLLVGMLALAFNVQQVRANPTIYIRANGSVEPLGVPISSFDNVTYTLTADIYDSIVVERNNIIVDGAGYTLEGPALASGISLSGRNNITIKNMKIKAFTYGICLNSSSNNRITGNTIIANTQGIYLCRSSKYNSINGNTITANNYGINGGDSGSNAISGNNITNNNNGIYLQFSDNNINGNNITNNDYGIEVRPDARQNRIYHNNFINNIIQVKVYSGATPYPVWDNGYPSGGNYWSNYNGTDHYSGPYQNETGSDGIGDTPYTIDGNNKDGYPFMTPLPMAITWDVAVVNVVSSKTVVGKGYSLDVNVTAANQGTFDQTFDVTLYAELYVGMGLAGYWKFDEGLGGTAGDSSGNNNNGTISGATWVSGKVGNALQFDGTDDYVQVPHSASLNLTNTGTIIAWIKIPSVEAVNRGNIVSKGGGWNRRGWMLTTIGYNRIRFHWQSGADKYIDSQTNFTYDEWHQIAAVMNGTAMKIYIDGIQDPNILLNTDLADTTNPVMIGRTDYSGYLPFKGAIDETRVYNRALSEKEIRVLATTELLTIQTKTVTIASGTSKIITFTWNTTGVPYGNYTISAYAHPVLGETDTVDNTYVDGKVVVTISGDFDGDGYVDLDDFVTFAGAYGTKKGDLAYNPNADLDGDGDIDPDDFAKFSGKYGQHW